ncbi:MAG: hypothetical protein EBV20_12120 [Betaproteobacteria bacterium]|jgi:hypothetical protein|nr:hypothetical protein [Betaproteobacteria bacterium]NBP45882.1 hypothetical protein [Betaproteobacteria bacterium]
MDDIPETGPKATEHAPVAEDEIYTRIHPESKATQFFKVHRISNTYFVFVQNEKAQTDEESWTYAEIHFETEPEAAHNAMIRRGFKWFNQDWWKN